jgi:hypothetical protein
MSGICQQARILILEISNIFIWLNFSPSLTLNKIEHFETGSKENNTMKIIARFSVLFLAVFVLITLPLVDGYNSSHAENPELSTVTFYVQ